MSSLTVGDSPNPIGKGNAPEIESPGSLDAISAHGITPKQPGGPPGVPSPNHDATNIALLTDDSSPNVQKSAKNTSSASLDRLRPDERKNKDLSKTDKMRESDAKAKQLADEMIINDPSLESFKLKKGDRHGLDHSYTVYHRDGTMLILRNADKVDEEKAQKLREQLQSHQNWKTPIAFRVVKEVGKILGVGGRKIAEWSREITTEREASHVIGKFHSKDQEIVYSNIIQLNEYFRNKSDYKTGLTAKQLLVLPHAITYEGKYGRTLATIAEYMDTDMANLTKTGAINGKTLLGALVQVGQGIAFMHRNRWVHRDLKPANFGINFNPEKPNKTDARPSDFDSAMSRNDLINKLNGEAYGGGTNHYMAPETYIDGRPDLDGKSDVYSFGASILEMLLRCNYEKSPLNQLVRNYDKGIKETDILKTLNKYLKKHHIATLDPTNNPLHQLIIDCLSPRSSKRPTMDEAVEKLTKLFEETPTDANLYLEKGHKGHKGHKGTKVSSKQ